jgi:plasmid stabilization system protein ParE
MSNFRVVFSPEAQEQLELLYLYIAEAAAPVTAARYTEIVTRLAIRATPAKMQSSQSIGNYHGYQSRRTQH